MAKFCTECGKEIAENETTCAECGSAVSAPVNDSEENKAAEEKAAPEAVAVATVVAEPEKEQPEAVTAKKEPETDKAKPVSPAPDPSNKVISTFSYFLLMLLFFIPVVGLFSCIILSFAPKNKNLKHFARAVLIWTVISFVVIGIVSVAAVAVMNTVINTVSRTFGSWFGGVSDVVGSISDVGAIAEQVVDMGKIIGEIDRPEEITLIGAQIGGAEGLVEIFEQVKDGKDLSGALEAVCGEGAFERIIASID